MLLRLLLRHQMGSAYLTLSVGFVHTSRRVVHLQDFVKKITMGITLLITGRITLLGVATLPAPGAPAVAASAKYFLVFSEKGHHDFCCLLTLEQRNTVSCHLLSKSSDIIFSLI